MELLHATIRHMTGAGLKRAKGELEISLAEVQPELEALEARAGELEDGIKLIEEELAERKGKTNGNGAPDGDGTANDNDDGGE